MRIEPIAFFHSPFSSKFGIPRQSGIVGELKGEIRFVKEYAQAEALRGLEQYDYPLLGGNERVGVWASRSPFRPNNLGLSSVRIIAVHPERPSIEVAGADLMDGTPVYDIKPYLPYVDSHPEARGGFTDDHQWQRLRVEIPEVLRPGYTEEEWRVIEDILSLDPRPHYHEDSRREYGMPYAGRDIRFKVSDGVLTLVRIVKM